MSSDGRTLFGGMAPEAAERFLASLERRRFGAGSPIVREGDQANEMYVIVSGFARVVGNEDGAEHAVNVIGPGAPVGEMAMLAGRPRAASVHATSDVEAAVLSIADFHRLASEYPRIYQDLGAIQSDRLAAMLERFVSGSFGRVTVMIDEGAPPLLGYALACSIAWHTRGPTALV